MGKEAGRRRAPLSDRAGRLLLAARAYLLERGVLPESLEDLVPRYLPEIPIDAFDGKPFKYSRKKGVLYSIGGDLIDDGGGRPDVCPPLFGVFEWAWMGDPSWRIEWK